jgi:hypothetical protein
MVDFLFDPKAVDRRLADLPHLRKALGDPHQEGEPSAAFPAARRSPLEIYRVLGNLHYAHLDELVGTLESVLESGFEQPTILRTHGRKPFAEALAELQTAAHLLLRGFQIETARPGEGQVPDVLARGHGIELAVEVYCPRQWEGLHAFFADLADAVKNLDLGFDYRFEVAAAQLEWFDDEQRLLILHPAELARALDATTRDQLLEELVGELAAKLEATRGAVSLERQQPDLNIKLSIRLDEVRESTGVLPARTGCILPPSTSGYRPEGMFEQIVERVVRKAAKGPAVGHASLSLLVVELSRSELASELAHPSYRKTFEQSLQRRLGRHFCGYDMIALCEADGWGRELRLHWLVHEDRVPRKVARALFAKHLA